jgi:hypothetical protein
MTISDDPAARDALRLQLFQSIDGVPPDAAEGVVGSFPGLLARCDDLRDREFGAEGFAGIRVAGQTLFVAEGQQPIVDAIVVARDLIADFRRFAVQVRELLTRETERLGKLPRSAGETIVDVTSTPLGVRFAVGGALLRGGLDQSATVDVQQAIHFALDVLSCAFDHQAGRFDEPEGNPAAVLHAPCGDVLEGDEAGERYVCALDKAHTIADSDHTDALGLARWPVTHGPVTP